MTRRWTERRHLLGRPKREKEDVRGCLICDDCGSRGEDRRGFVKTHTKLKIPDKSIPHEHHYVHKNAVSSNIDDENEGQNRKLSMGALSPPPPSQQQQPPPTTTLSHQQDKLHNDKSFHKNNYTMSHYNNNKQKRRVLTIPWSYVCGVTLFALGLISLFTGHVASDLDWYSHRSPITSKLEGSRKEPIDIWESTYSKFFYGCSQRSSKFALATREQSSNGYLLIGASGGLNQQRTGIIDAVVVARILNATLVVPELDHHSFWKDDSEFEDIFDVSWFISYLANDVRIVKRVPNKFMRSMEKPPYTMRVPRKSPPEYYVDQVLPILLRRQVVQLTKFDYRLANDLDENLQKLRCRVNYHALRFTKPIQDIGQKLVSKMRSMARRFIAVHLRFEPDMLAFTGCYYGGEKERSELSKMRKRWETLPDLGPEGEQARGKCPLTPHEVGLMLRGLGFDNDSYLYVASGEIYGGEDTLQPLKQLFPNFYTKEMLANEELKPFLPFSSRLAAIDYIVCDESDVFVTNNNGNMAKILAGRRRYMGHKRTIRPNAKKLSKLFMAWDKMDWDSFTRKVKAYQRGFLGEPGEMRPGRGEFHEYPASCVCKQSVRMNMQTSPNLNLRPGQ